ncbi:MAG: thioredoxin domain-containing protein [Myxococcota bacterium]
MNRLTHESSPYLRQHAANPVDWYPWGEEALVRAREEDKPIHLSVGYSACHWCHVMAHECFEDKDIARVMNEHFVNIKVDREERPDLDQIYQGVVQLMGRGGGWPLTVFLTPDLRPFFGGTYFPPDDRHGMPSFPRLLLGLSNAWKKQRNDVEAQAEELKKGLLFLGAYGLDVAPAELSTDDVVRAARRLEEEIDRVHGGFGTAPKFPNPMNVALLLRGYRRTKDDNLSSAVTLTLERMAKGGIYDQLGGGFHRYSVDERWLVPHFEKMLYDNAQLVHLYAEAEQVAPRPLWRKVVEETVEYLRREMTSPGGGFYATQDADSEGEEGKFFVWTPAQLDEVLPSDLSELAKAHFNVRESGNFEHGSTVLEVVRDAEDLAKASGREVAEVEKDLERVRQLLFAARRARVAPGRDDKVLAGWNGLMIRGLSFAARAFNRPEWATLAVRAADFVLEHQWREGRLWRVYQDGRARIDGFLEDYGDFASGLVALYQATFDAKYLEVAERIVDVAVERFFDARKNAYLTAPRAQKDLLVPTYTVHDNAFPSGASSLTEAQVALAALTGRQRHLSQAERYLKKMRDEAARNPFAFGHWWLAADAWLDGAAEVTVVGPRDMRAPLVETVNGTYAPTVSLAAVDLSEAVPEVLSEVMVGRVSGDGRAAAYLCRHFACRPPIFQPAELRAALTG